MVVASMKKILLFLVLVGCASAQSTFNALHQPDCIIAFSLTGTANTAAFDNRGVGCSGWSIQWSNYNFSPVSVTLQSAPNNNGVPGTWVTFAGQSICNGGSNPSSSTTTSATWLTGYNPFVRVSATLTGSGLLQGTALGWKDPALVCPAVTASIAPGSAVVVTSGDVIDAGNSTTTPLGAGATFTGTGHSTIGFMSVQISIDTDQANSANGFQVQWSSDDTNWADVDFGQVNSSDILPTGQTYIFPVKRPYYRVVYTASGAQTTFRLQSVLKVEPTTGATIDLGDAISGSYHTLMARDMPFGRSSLAASTFNDITVKNPATPAIATDPAIVVTVSPNNTVPVQIIGDGTVLSGQQAVTGSAAALATNTAKTACVKALIGNTINVYVGPSGITTSTGMELAPGEIVCLPVTNTNLLYVIASTTGASVSWIATN